MSPTSPDRIVLTDLHRQELTGLIRAGRTEQSDHPTLARLGHRLRRSSLTGNANQAADGSRALMVCVSIRAHAVILRYVLGNLAEIR